MRLDDIIKDLEARHLSITALQEKVQKDIDEYHQIIQSNFGIKEGAPLNGLDLIKVIYKTVELI